MLKEFFILLEEFSNRPTTEIGQICKQNSELTRVGIVVPKSVCVPISTLKLIAKTNELNKKIEKLVEETDRSDSVAKSKIIHKIKKLITKQKIPDSLAKEFLKLYHQYLQSSFVLIQNSQPIKGRYISVNNIQGDINVINILMNVWADLTELSLKHTFTKTVNLNTILFQSPIFIQQQIDCHISGKALSFDQRDGNKRRFTIKTYWGVDCSSQDANTYIIDSRTFNIIKETKGKQRFQYIRNTEGIKKQKIGIKKQTTNPLTKEQVANLAKIILKISRLSLNQLEIYWGLQNNLFFIKKIKEVSYDYRIEAKTTKTIKKIYLATTNMQDINLVNKYIDGIGIFNTGQLLTLMGNHPMHTIKLSQKKLLLEAISRTITRYVSIKENLDVIYKVMDLASNQLLKLNHSTNYEEKELNPFLGLRGVAKILAQPQVFNFELEIIKKIIKNTNQKISLLLPFVRSSEELDIIIKLIHKKNLTAGNNFDIWFELSTPDNVFNIEKYSLNKVSGIAFNIRNIASLMFGIDPSNHELFNKYVNGKFIGSIIDHTLNVLSRGSKGKLMIDTQKILVDLTQINSGAIKNVITKNIGGVIVNRQLTATAKKCIINEENKIIYGKN